MKRTLSVLALILVLALLTTTSSVVLAESLHCWPWPFPWPPDDGGGSGGGGGNQDPDPGNGIGSSQTVYVGAEVLPYGEIQNLSGSLHVGQLSGESGATVSEETDDFQIVRNAPLTVTLSITKPLTLINSKTGDFREYSIETTAELLRQNPKSGRWGAPVISATRGPSVPEDQWSATCELGEFEEYVAEKFKNWRLRVTATLGDIDDQPAGTYGGEIVLTISAPSGS
ncbi:MAG: hypothetical protein WBH42_07450 [Bacillota bacterium]|nr:hypothetical protein [Bacillota bacterium]